MARNDKNGGNLAVRILAKALEDPQPYHELRKAEAEAKATAAIALMDGDHGKAGQALELVGACGSAREMLQSIGGPEAITAARKAKEKRAERATAAKKAEADARRAEAEDKKSQTARR